MSGLSRKNRILNLALNLNKNNDSPVSTSEKETGCQRYTNVSPLPPAAENIDVDMAEVWRDVFYDNDRLEEKSDPHHHYPDTNYVTSDQVANLTASDHVVSPPAYLSSASHTDEVLTDSDHVLSPPAFLPSASHADEVLTASNQAASPPTDLPLAPHTDEVLTPLNIEVTSSFNNSPAIYIEEFEEPAISTPSSSHMVLATPMPSPVNVHKKCNDPFCSDHSTWIDSMQSPNNSVSHILTPETAPKRKSKKRSVRRQDWSDARRKYLTNLGKSYVSKRGKFVEDKMMGKPCSCKYKCSDKMTEEQRLECFNRFWKLGHREKQWMYVAKYVKKAVKNRCLNRSTPNKRQYTFSYFLPLISSKTDTIPIKVCKTMFLQTLAVSESIIKTTFQKYDGVGDVEHDHRGKHENHKCVIDNDMIRSVCDHVNAFAPVESHFIRKDSTKLYLDGSLSISRMYKMYHEWYDESVYTSKAKTERQYRDIVNKNYNLGFHIPKKDQCEVCHAYRNNSNPNENDKVAYEEHVNAKKTARNIKQSDKHDALESQGEIVAAVFDFQKILNSPHGQISIFYYKRKLSALNFTVFDMAKKKAVCYMWDETIAKRGANEVSSCLLAYITDHVKEGAKEFRFWSDNCAGQNRNRYVFSLYLYAAKQHKVSITHRFLEKGHTQNEGDSVHALIERSSFSKTIYTPDEWRLLVRWAKTEGEPYLVKDMTQENFFNFKVLVNDKLWSKNTRQQKVLWTKVKEIFVDKSECNKLYYKYDLNEKNYECVIIRTDTRNSTVPVLQNAYSSPLKLTQSKYKDLISMCNSGVINSSNSTFFRSLPHNSTGRNDQINDMSEEDD